MVQVIWTQPALEDLESIHEYLARDAARYAEEMVRKLLKTPGILTRFPQIGRVVPEYGDESLREILAGMYRVIYKESTDRVHVVAVVHGSRDLLLSHPDEDFVIE